MAKARKPYRLTHLANPMLSGDAKHLAIQVVTAGPILDLEIPMSEIGTVIQFLAGCADHLASRAEADEVDVTPDRASFSPIQIHGLGLATGSSAAETLLVVQFAGFDLAFSLDSEKLAALGRDFARTAQTLSAPATKPQ